MSTSSDHTTSDAELLAAVAEGDPEAFVTLYDQHAPWLLVRLRQRTDNPDLADQVAQETFLVVWRDAGRFQGRGAVGAWIWGIAIRRLLDAQRGRLGYMPQEPGFHARFTAFEFVDYVAILKELHQRRARHDEVRRVPELVGLGSVRHKQIKALSGGMRRRVALAQALLGDPDLVLLDEPTAGLDPEQRLRFRELVGRLGEGRTVLLSTHQTEDVVALCQQVLVMHLGQVRFAGTPPELTGLARGRVWQSHERDPGALAAWRTGTGQHRNIGDPPAGADLLEPTMEDGYLLLLGGDQVEEAAA